MQPTVVLIRELGIIEFRPVRRPGVARKLSKESLGVLDCLRPC